MDDILGDLDNIEADLNQANEERDLIEKDEKKQKRDDFFDDALADIDLQVEKNVNHKKKSDIQGELTKFYMNLLMYHDQVNQEPIDDNDYEIYDIEKMYEYYEEEEDNDDVGIYNGAHRYFMSKYPAAILKEEYDQYAAANFS
mmetsp:Transcript_4834/g.4085  ORF Transcript_4834/g.4085 Transcript_4834/m.4085 type:complete len:143 (+) Transcript_4834:24-452(+)